MRLNPSAVNNLVYLCQNYGGHKEETKLLAQINNLRFSPYMDTNGNVTLVDSLTLVKEMTSRNMPIKDVVAMRLHSSAIHKIMKEYDINSGHVFETKLQQAFMKLDFTPYDRKMNGNNDTILILTEEYLRVVNGASA